MGHKIQLSESRKAEIKAGFDSINPASLSGDELRYYNLIKAGKSRSKKSIRLQGRFLSGEIVGIIEKVAKKKGISLRKYLDQNQTDIIALVESGYTHVFKRVDDVIDIVGGSKRKTIDVNDGNGMMRIEKLETIQRLAKFQNYVKSNSDIVELMIRVKLFKNNRIQITIPPNAEDSNINFPDSFEDFTDEQLEDYLDYFEDIEYIVSDKKGKK